MDITPVVEKEVNFFIEMLQQKLIDHLSNPVIPQATEVEEIREAIAFAVIAMFSTFTGEDE